MIEPVVLTQGPLDELKRLRAMLARAGFAALVVRPPDAGANA